ncbi:MAG: hypothetical protein AAGK37_22445 [Pseudomonadota bacterium]
MLSATILDGYDEGTGRQLSLYGGYQIRREAFVYGVEASWSNLVDVSDGNLRALESLEMEAVGDLRARLGYVAGELMFYGVLGWS